MSSYGHQPTVAEIRLNNVVGYLTVAVSTLRNFSDLFSTPFLKAISNTTVSLLESAQLIHQCTVFLEQIHAVICGIVGLYAKSGRGSSVVTCDSRKSRKFHEVFMFFWRRSRPAVRLKRFLRQNETNLLLKDCQGGLELALGVFKIQTGAAALSDFTAAQEETQRTHAELLRLIATYSDDATSDQASSMYGGLSGLENSSTSFSMLPSEPKIFNGRDSEIQEIVDSLEHEFGRIAILGTGGIGKTSLARAVLHHPQITAKYSSRFFVPCDSAHIWGRSRFHQSHKIHHPVSFIQFIILLIMDNLETVWEPSEFRGTVEEFLSLLTDIPHLALIRLANLVDIADDFHEKKHIKTLLSLTGNLPLAVGIIAHLVDYEGCLHPRLASYLDARDLLSLLSLLPDGISDGELSQSNLPLKDLLGCKAALLRTSLAYTDHGRLKALVPIREYMGNIYPPIPAVVHPLSQYFHMLLQLYRRYHGHQLGQLVDQITPNLGNLHSIILWGLNLDNPDIRDTLHCAMALVGFQRVTSQAKSISMSQIAPLVDQLGDSHLKALFITDLFLSWHTEPISNPDELIREAEEHFASINDLPAECKFYYAVGPYFSIMSRMSRKLLNFSRRLWHYHNFKILRTEAEVYSLKSEYREARAIYADIIRETSPELAPMNYGFALLNIIVVDILIGSNLQEAEARMDVVKSIFRSSKQFHALTFCDGILGDLKLRQGDRPTAKALLEKCFNSLRGYDMEGMLYCLEQLGDTCRWGTENLAVMAGWPILFLGQALKANNKLAINQALRYLGDVFLAQGDTTTATSLFNTALEAFTQMDVHLAKGHCLIRLGDISHQGGTPSQAVKFWNMARPLFERSSQKGYIQQIDERLAEASGVSAG
ncbi:hypothetical protein B0H14DRAFT_2811975 [Mycena olivaceomarginata]|nr:hypothetical protein B0H14DRAFT_2811975 [Mycena olivaceomarginata]